MRVLPTIALFMHAAPVTPVAAAQDFLSWERSGAVELEYITDAESGEALNTLTTLALRNKWTLGRDGSGGAIVLNTRLWSDAEHPAAAAADHIEKLVGYLEIPYESLMLQAGQMEIQWGENLFMPVLDVVNQRDVNHPRGYYDPAAKVPARMLNAEWGTQDLSLQVIYIPTPQPLRQPEEVAGFKVATSDRHEPYRDAEYGGRFGLQLAGIDARIYHFRHWARVPAYTFTAFSGQGDLAQEDRLSETNGLSFSYAGYSWLLRGDLARHTAFPATSIGTAVEWSPLTQAILGMQWTTGGGQSVSGELHHDHWDEEPAAWSDGAFVATTKAPRDLTWVVLSANMTFFSGKFEPVLLAMRGIQKSDLLVRAIPVWNATESLSLALELQKTRAESNSPKLLLDQRETVSFRASWSF